MDFEVNLKEKPYRNKNLIPSVRNQKKTKTCFIHSCCTCTESLYKRSYALEDPQRDFEIIFSEDHLKELYEKKHGKIGEELGGTGFIRVKRISEILIKEGAIGIDENGERCGPYKISSFQELDPLHHAKSSKACPNPEAKMPHRVQEILSKRHSSMVGTFKVSDNYLTLKPGDIYSYNRHAPLVIDGHRASHAVAIIGYGVRGGEWYYVYQNSYGKGWGDEGIGRVNMRSLSHLVQLKL